MAEETGPGAYRIHVWIQHITPMIRRRLVVPSESTLADLHYAIQIAFAWIDHHFHPAKLRWRVEQNYHQLKEKLVLDHYEGAAVKAGITMSPYSITA